MSRFIELYRTKGVLRRYLSYDARYKITSQLSLLGRHGRAPEGASILNLGCGFSEILDHCRPSSYVGIDIVADAGKHIERHAEPSFQFVPLQDKESLRPGFEIIFASHVLEHVKEPHETVEWLTGLLSFKGVLLIALPLNEIFEDPEHLFRFTPEGIHQLLGDLKILETRECDLWGRYWACIKGGVGVWGSLPGWIRSIIANIPAFVPFKIWELIERVLSRSIPRSQLLVLAEKT